MIGPCPNCGEPINVARVSLCRVCWEEANLDASFPLGRDSRARYDCIVTFENDAGETLTLHREGPPREGVKQACAIALARDESYRIVAISSPETIYRDLQGTRAAIDPDRYSANQVYYPETNSARHVRAMLHPRLTRPRSGP